MIDVIDEIIAFYFQYLEISLYSKKKKITIEDVLNKMLEHHMPFEINEYFLLDFSEEESRYLAKCIISFLTSMDLEKMFTQDRELAFLSFEKIRYNKTNDIEKNLREHGITFMDDKYQNLQEKMQKLSLIKK